MPRRVYWDSCVFLGLLNGERHKVDACRQVWEEAERGQTIIVTSSFTVTEVVRLKCEGNVKPLRPDRDEEIVAMLTQKWIQRWILDDPLALDARRLVRSYTECKKPADGIHLATALRADVDEMHTYDGSDLLKLDGKIQKRSGYPLAVCVPKPIPASPPERGMVAGELELPFEDA